MTRKLRCWHVVSAVGLLVLVVAIWAWTERDLILRDAAQLWVVSSPPVHADAILVLGGGLETRPFAAATLYKEGLSERVLISNSNIRGPAERLGLLPVHSELNRQVLVKLGVPPQSITFLGDDLRSTYAEARALADWTKTTKAKRIIVPTELFPSRRVQWILDRELRPAGVTIIVVACDPTDYTVDNWWRDPKGIIEFQNEILKYLYYRFRY